MSQLALRVNHRGQSEQHPLRDGRSVVGRAASCDIVLDDHSVSREHAALLVSNGRLRVVDLNSRNGTFLNGEAVQQVDLVPGDNVTFGGVVGVVEYAQDPALVLERTRTIRLKDVFPVAERPVADAPRLIRLLAEIARTLTGNLTLPEILRRVFELLFVHIKAEGVCLLMVEQSTGELTPVLVQRSDGRPVKRPVISKTVIDTALTQRVAVVTIDALVDTRFDEALSIHSAEVRSLMCAPLFAADEFIGALYVDNTLAAQFSEADLELFTALANYAAVAIAQATMADQLIEERRRRERLQRYHSPAVVERILARQSEDVALPAEEHDISVLFADIVEFTTMAESMRPAEVATLLNTFFSRTVEAIFTEQGTIDKFIGDAILAVFGAPVEQPDHALRAVRAAQAMREVVDSLNAERSFPHLRVRYAINSGIAIAGDIGPTKRQEYTVLGDVVNIASRLQVLAKPDQLVVSRATFDRLRGSVPATSLGEFAVRGRAGKIEVLAIDR
jgi:adenylate cyclase